MPITGHGRPRHMKTGTLVPADAVSALSQES